MELVPDLVIGQDDHDVRVNGQFVEFYPTELLILRLLASFPGQTLTRVKILDGIHGERYAITPRAVDGQIVGIRKKLGRAAVFVETVRGVGYRFNPSPTIPSCCTRQREDANVEQNSQDP